ncbi:MAG TPA: DNA-formamidopyrimidine glycosylase family protein, partial [Burkholderiaceae bacterium]|nr:DNA-formamidopyrimidine glycosylase family protein [Burkholderiaceae bacterium]
MPELPDIAVYAEALRERVVGAVLQRVRLLNPFLLRTAVPPIAQAEGRRVAGIERLGKRVVLQLDAADGADRACGADHEPWFLVIHLMIAGRLRWLAPGA